MDWIEPGSESPIRYHFWSAATIVAAALKRNCWVDRVDYKLYPNLYTILVGPPGVGKGGAWNPAISILAKSNTINIMTDRLTMPDILERLSKGFPSTNYINAQTVSLGINHATMLGTPELPILLQRDPDFIANLTELWDSREYPREYGTRHSGKFKIEKACVNLLGAASPQALADAIPPGSAGNGFTRRVMFVYEPDPAKDVPWPEKHKFPEDIFVDELRYIANKIQGEYTFSPEAKKVWEVEGKPNMTVDFEDEAIASFKSTRRAHLAKLSMIIAASQSDIMVIEKSHIELALRKLLEIEKGLPKVFRCIGESDLIAAADRVLSFIEVKGYATRDQIMQANWRHLSSPDTLTVILATLVEGKVLFEDRHNGRVVYKPTK